jgi:hypothetical protein
VTLIDIELVGGDLFDDAEKIVDSWLEDVKDSYAQQGISRLHQLMDQSFRNPTPYYETQVTIDRSGADRVIHDRGVIYGPWLEGVGSRNRTTRFKGYHHWRRTVQYLEQEEGPAILERHFPVLVKRLS